MLEEEQANPIEVKLAGYVEDLHRRCDFAELELGRYVGLIQLELQSVKREIESLRELIEDATR